MAPRLVTIRIEEELLDDLDALAAEKGVSRSALIREAIKLLLKLEHGKVTRKEPKTVRLMG
jgi:metal-responsive CopG/Arc/MetJ family transcriptional regulator